MKHLLLSGLCSLFFFCSCKKTLFHINTSDLRQPTATADGFRSYTIKRGNHYSEGNAYKAVELTQTQILFRFDSTAVYTTVDPQNQYDINKLWGFSDNGGNHHEYSARLGWRWSDGALRLFAYVYNAGKVSAEEICTVAIGAEVRARISVTTSQYIFWVNDRVVALPRLATTAAAKGYQLYPYFGGDETAPHDINILVKEG